MSQNVVDATIRLAYRHRQTVMVIASRSQVESEDFGSGYVQGWSTESFIKYIRSRDPAGLVKICRDHGGPWQHPAETGGNLSEEQVMSRSLESLLHDIEQGADIVHIDTSREADGPAPFERAVSRLVQLYGECEYFTRQRGRDVQFEVGLEQQSDAVDDPKEFRAKLEYILAALAGESLRSPTFVVGQTGTKVVGTENRGRLVFEQREASREISQLAEICWEHGLALKAHNSDYLPRDALSQLISNGVDAVNIAPEYGVTETRAFLTLLDELGLRQLRDEFLALAYDSGSWRKWYDGVPATDLQRCIAAGHYVFSTAAFRDIKREAEAAGQGRTKTIDAALGDVLDDTLERHAAEVWKFCD